MRTLLTLILIQWLLPSQAQTHHILKIQPVFGNKALPFLAEEGGVRVGKRLEIQTLRFYISRIVLLEAGKAVWEEADSFHLLDLRRAESWQLPLRLPKDLRYTEIQFHIGIDSTTSVSGAMGGDLDPMRGMYWTWQSGYINFKLEGQQAGSDFEFHIGGYQSPYNMLQTVRLAAASPLQLQMDLQPLLEAVDWKQTHHIMRPNAAAKNFAEGLPALFSIRP